MKRSELWIRLALLFPACLSAEVPGGFNYQAVVRDERGNLVRDGKIGLCIAIVGDSVAGKAVFSETHVVNTNGHGTLSAVIGKGDRLLGDLQAIPWESGRYYLSVGVDLQAGTACKHIGTSQLMSVPYAMFAGSVSGKPTRSSEISDADGDTRVQTEASPDEDRVRMFAGGKEAFRLAKDGFVGLGLGGGDPGEMLHLGDGHILLEGGGQVALKIKRDTTITDGPSGRSQNPIFQIGRIIRAGDGDPELRFLYSDDQHAERTVFELDRKGIVASVKQEVGSHFEGFLDQRPDPCFRLNSWPKMQLEMGSCLDPVDVFVRREEPGVLSLLTGGAEAAERVRVSEKETAFSGYVKLPVAAGAPPASDCSQAAHRGRMKVDAQAGLLWICADSGWISK